MPRKRKRQKQPPGNRPATFSNRPLSGLRDLARAQQHPEEPAGAQSRPQPRPAGPGSGLHQDDETTFRQAMVGVKPLQPRPAERPGRTPRPPRETAGAREEREVMLELERLVEKNGPVPAHLSGEAIEGTASGVDRFLLARLRRGDFSLQAHLDLHGLTREQARQEVNALHRRNIKVQLLGRREGLPLSLLEAINHGVHLTRHNTDLVLNLALNYGGRAEIVKMVQEISKKIKAGSLDSSCITPEMISEHLYTRGLPDPDLLIRTSGEMRISNFLLWQIAYSEFFITDTLWPDFSKEEFIQILKDYQKRKRRFGKVGI